MLSKHGENCVSPFINEWCHNNNIDDLAVHEHLGLTLSSNLSWSAHVLKLYQKASKKLNLLKPLKYKLSRYSLEVLCKSLVHSSLEHADAAFVNERSCYSLCLGNDLCLPYVQTERHRKSFLFSSSQLWNSLPSELHLSSSLSSFKNNISKDMKFPICNYR